MYSKTVMDHFRNPRNVGVIEDPDGVGEVGNPLCGDMMTIYLKIANEHIEDIKFQTFGCGSAIAVSSMLTEIAMGKSIEEAKKILEEAKKLGVDIIGLSVRIATWNCLKIQAFVMRVSQISRKTTRNGYRTPSCVRWPRYSAN